MSLGIDAIRDLPAADAAATLLGEAEGQWFDRKSARISGLELAKTLSSMANAEGGVIVIGLHNGVCEGIGASPGRRQSDWRQAGLDYTDPPVSYSVDLVDCVNRQGDADRLFVISILPSGLVHSTARDEAYLRVGDEDRRLNFEQRIQLRYDRNDTGFERTPASAYRETELDPEAVAQYAERLGSRHPERLLQARDLADASGEPYIAGLLLFGRNPQRACPQAYVRVLKYLGRERGYGSEQNLIEDFRCEGALPQQMEAARRKIAELLPKRKALGTAGIFEWFDIVPEPAWLEALVNAVVHRAYSNFGDHIRVELYDDRIEVHSPGRFPGVSTLADLTDIKRFARNPRIARVMADFYYGQELGEGLRRMVELMESSGRPRPSVTQSGSSVTVTLSGVILNMSELRTLPQPARALFQQLAQVRQASTGDIVQLTGYSRPVVLRNLRLLESRGLVQHTGTSRTDPRAYWSIII